MQPPNRSVISPEPMNSSMTTLANANLKPNGSRKSALEFCPFWKNSGIVEQLLANGGRSMRSILIVLLACTVLSHAGDTATDIDLTPIKALTLSIEQWHMVTGDRLTQTIDVSEGESFRVVTTANGIRWTTKGVVGKPRDNTISVQLTTEWYKNDRSNEQGKQILDLKLSGETSPSTGALHGVSVAASLKRNERR
jgi:hypothetical protein